MADAQVPETILGPRDGARASRAPAEAKKRTVIPLTAAALTPAEAV
ncbi:hypothetical protein [Actinomadura oligospora]|nr:hypothetical protein [Actinomadura oligospora]